MHYKTSPNFLHIDLSKNHNNRTYLSWIILKHDNPKIQSPKNGIVLAYKRYHIFYANPLYFELSSHKKAMFPLTCEIHFIWDITYDHDIPVPLT